MRYLADLKNNTLQQQHLPEQDQLLQTTEYKAYESLAKNKVIAPIERIYKKARRLAKSRV